MSYDVMVCDGCKCTLTSIGDAEWLDCADLAYLVMGVLHVIARILRIYCSMNSTYCIVLHLKNYQHLFEK